MSTQGQESEGLSSSTWGKLGLAAGAVACVPPLPLFGLQLQKLPNLEQWVLTAVFVASLAICGFAASPRPVVGVLLLPPAFFGLMCLACWWVANR